MITLAYIDTRPLIYVLAIAFILLVNWVASRFFAKKPKMGAPFAVFLLVFTVAYGFFMYGPYVGYTKTQTYDMIWQLSEPSPQHSNEAHVVLTFVKYPGHRIGYYSDPLAAHLMALNTNTVAVTIEMTMDYGDVRGYHAIDIGGFTDVAGAYGSVHGNQHLSPWK